MARCFAFDSSFKKLYSSLFSELLNSIILLALLAARASLNRLRLSIFSGSLSGRKRKHFSSSAVLLRDDKQANLSHGLELKKSRTH